MNASSTGLLLAAAATPSLWFAPDLFWATWLAAWWWCVGLVMGALVSGWIHRLSGGAWGHSLAPAIRSIASRMPLALLAGTPLVFGFDTLYPWLLEPRQALPEHIAYPAFQHAWLSPEAFATRVACYVLLWAVLARLPSPRRAGTTALALIGYLFATSFAAFDLLMALMPRFYSSAFGLVASSLQVLGGTALAVHAAARLQAPRIGGRGQPIARDLANLMLMWVSLWAYLAYMEWLIVYAENLPREIAWYLPRVQGPWAFAGVAMVLLQLMLPLCLLLFRALKDRPVRLAWIARLLLAANALATVWMVVPSVAPDSPHTPWVVPLVFGGLALFVFGGRRAALGFAALPHGRGRSATEGADVRA